MYVRAALLALALGHASATTNDDTLAALQLVDDAQLMAEVARRNLAAPQDHRALSVEQHYSFKYECSCDPTPAPVSSQPTPAPQVGPVCDLCATKDGAKTKCGKGGKFLLPGGTCDDVADGQVCTVEGGRACLECKDGKHKTWTLGTSDPPGYTCVESRRRLDGPAARPAWATGAPQEESSPMIPSWASGHRGLKNSKKGKGSCYIPGSDTELPQCKKVGKCGDKCGKLKCGKGYVTGTGEDDCVKAGCPKCKDGKVNYLSCDNCVDEQDVCDAEEDDCLKDEDACEAIPDATFCPKYEGGDEDGGKCGKFGKCGNKYWFKESGKGGKFKCAKNGGYCTNDCEDGFINYESCDNCVDKEAVCDGTA